MKKLVLLAILLLSVPLLKAAPAIRPGPFQKKSNFPRDTFRPSLWYLMKAEPRARCRGRGTRRDGNLGAA